MPAVQGTQSWRRKVLFAIETVFTVRCGLRVKKQLSIGHTTEPGTAGSSTLSGEIEARVGVSVKKRPMKWAVEQRVDIVAAGHMTSRHVAGSILSVHRSLVTGLLLQG